MLLPTGQTATPACPEASHDLPIPGFSTVHPDYRRVRSDRCKRDQCAAVAHRPNIGPLCRRLDARAHTPYPTLRNPL